MWAYSFMQHALWSGLIIATVCGIMSVFIVLRRSAFAAHALGHMSITGAAAAALLGQSIIIGQLVLNLICALIMGVIGDKVKKNDLAVGVVLTFVLGCGAYFLFLFQNNYAGGVMSILFGNILAVSVSQIYILSGLSTIILAIIVVIARPLLFASIDPVIASSKNVPLRYLTIIFFMLLALTVSMACQIVGALLVFVMLVIPGAIGIQWGGSIYKIILISIIAANSSVILALIIAYNFNLPVSFCITTILSLGYIGGIFKK
ncbi:MAG: metal ABC transporter permease [Burkholderiales bacterium]|nr:metal ABC transporter permease [Burkholderiales bacterium]